MDFIINFPEQAYSSFEYQANEFAGRLLVPYDNLATIINNQKKIIRDNKLENILKDDPDMVLAMAASKMAKHFGVSEQTIRIRAVKEKLWPPSLK